jgi:hypothetical protein
VAYDTDSRPRRLDGSVIYWTWCVRARMIHGTEWSRVFRVQSSLCRFENMSSLGIAHPDMVDRSTLAKIIDT